MIVFVIGCIVTYLLLIQEYLEDCDEVNADPIAMATFLKGRLEVAAYKLFILRFVRPIVGLIEFDRRVNNTQLKAFELCTVSDEAFAMLVLENNYDRWLDIFERNDCKKPHPKRQKESKRKQFYSDKKPLYTEGGIMFNNGNSSGQKLKVKAGVKRALIVIMFFMS